MKNILDYTRTELMKWFENQGIRPFRAGQIFKWIYLKQANEFDEMTDLGKDMRNFLAKHFIFTRLQIEDHNISKDKTEKILFRLIDGNYIESVLIPAKEHLTLCISSQVGCPMACRFCLTAKSGLIRNLSVAEIISQIRDIRHNLLERGVDPLMLSNIVFMGMGEPLANYDNLIKALDIITDTDFGLKFSPRRVTVSTCGLAPKILALGRNSNVNLAVSLNAVNNEKRSTLMPINKKYPLDVLVNACKHFDMKPRNKITFEYVLLQGENDSDQDALKLINLLSPIRAKVNLIPFNGYLGAEFTKPDQERVNAFLQILLDRGLTAIIRKSKGDDILAACGQLKAKHLSTTLNH